MENEHPEGRVLSAGAAIGKKFGPPPVVTSHDWRRFAHGPKPWSGPGSTSLMG
ncbi:carbon dioxide concentrating mechanism protein [Mesorhizobium sp. M7A.F.Ca.CA.001.09.2.1]|uniref:Carbon dioxide concentrating mechanism protein n=1 Tax=Mesorhizobium ciceri biovar biserrulae (strain HAMBI 2942 / LMG 23838 / WSM1271) TaxID=765698 RepID=E8TPS5_MESCW|nr:carbon dioxide concentrating mechanism protein [Mesorhizobium ciceri biovar biserrulae WSM1271]RUY62959.1 carbon dioxide concentrating mechanism protein [Mesorhizobium sp. M7A.F.Ca.CA.001.09.2.1]RUY65441.1 carbon dioxide concentrating mechanism protein [Mesorhizobium sp. M7A.F.Ca.CA.001.13.1.1]RUY68127.1 carbon dioxide concentrating mechanism protein [Mesorhizobium sp. M7A.F.Ca.CA.001.05.1.1]RUY89361.1 carbon dioxide concentrating mechanism protein [Mesorhizobium sp. M7A.F.Ca.CA.001.12.2.1]